MEAELQESQRKVGGLEKEVETLQGTLDYNQKAIVQDKKEAEARSKEQVGKLQKTIEEKTQQLTLKAQEVREQNQVIQDMQKLEMKLRQQVDDLQRSQSFNQS